MIINTAGEYTLQYTATDACGNSTTVERDLVVDAPPRTVLYTDGTFIINELGTDQATNTALHGQAIAVYNPFDPNGATDEDKYIFNGGSTQRPWASRSEQVTSVEIGSPISPTSTLYWFHGFNSCVSMDLTNLDTSNVTSMASMFYNCRSLTSLDLSGFDTSRVTLMGSMFRLCQALTSLDLSSFDTSLVTSMSSMFDDMSSLVTIYASELFVVAQVTNSSSMFDDCTSLVGGAGTTYNSSYINKTYAKIDGGTSDPGYFTAKS